MPPKLLVDLDAVDLGHVLIDKTGIHEYLPQRFEMEQLDAVHLIDREEQLAVGSREILPDEWWTRGHIPGRPLFPGVLMMESAAQLSTCLYKELTADPRFFGFGGIDDARFRGTVKPSDRLILLAQVRKIRSRRATFICQGAVDGKLVFECVITGVVI